jgi:hypothetical protein
MMSRTKSSVEPVLLQSWRTRDYRSEEKSCAAHYELKEREFEHSKDQLLDIEESEFAEY